MRASAPHVCALVVFAPACALESGLDRTFAPPDITVVSPEVGAAFERDGAPIEVLVAIEDDWDPPEDLDAWWLVDSETAAPLVLDELGEAVFAVNPALLELGWHTLTVGATDTDGETEAISVRIELVGPGGPRPPVLGELVISELMIDATAVADELGEWVEIKSLATDALDLSGLLLVDDDVDSSAISTPFVVPPGGVAVICAVDTAGTNGGVACDATFSWDWRGGGFALSNGGDEVVLTLADHSELDRMSYTGAQVSPGDSLALDVTRTDVADNDWAAAWCTQVPSPGLPNTGC